MHGPKCTQQRAPTPVLQPWERSCSGCYRLATWGKPAGSEDPRAQDISAPSRGSCQRVGSRARGIPSAALSRSREQRGRGVVTALTWGTHQALCVWVPPRDYRSVNGVSQSCKFSGDEKPISRLLPQNSVLPDACAVWRWLFKEVSRVRWRLRVGLLQHGRGHGDKTSPGTRAGRVGGGGTWRDGGSGPLLCPACSASICGGPSHPQSRPGRHPSDSVARGRLESRCTCEVPTSWGLCRGPCCRDRQPIIIAGGPSCQPGPGGVSVP